MLLHILTSTNIYIILTTSKCLGVKKNAFIIDVSQNIFTQLHNSTCCYNVVPLNFNHLNMNIIKKHCMYSDLQLLNLTSTIISKEKYTV